VRHPRMLLYPRTHRDRHEHEHRHNYQTNEIIVRAGAVWSWVGPLAGAVEVTRRKMMNCTPTLWVRFIFSVGAKVTYH